MKYNIMGIMQGMKQEEDIAEQTAPVPADEGDPKAEKALMPEAIDIADILQDEAKKVQEIDISLLDDNSDNHFSRMEGQHWEEFVGSIREYGILTPLIVRPVGARYEIIAGHNRKYGALEAGLDAVPCISADVDDVDASVMIGITNNQREHVTEWEKGWAYRTTLEAIRHQGVRSDMVSSGDDAAERAGERSVDVVARKYGVNRKTVQRKIRLTYLRQELYEYGVKQKYSQPMMMNLSYLTDMTQGNLLEVTRTNDLKLTEAQTGLLREAGADHDLTAEEIISLCKDKMATTKPKKPKAYRLSEDLFPAGVEEKLRQKYTEAALRFFLKEGIDPLMIDDTSGENRKEGGGA